MSGDWVPLAELEALLGVSRRTLQRRIRAGLVDVTTIGGSRFGRPVIASGNGDTPTSDRDGATADFGGQSATDGDRNAPPRDALALVVAAQERVQGLERERAGLVKQLLEAERQAAVRAVDVERVRGELAELRVIAETAVRDVEREREERERLAAEREQAAAERDEAQRRAAAEHERSRRLATAAQLPWYRRRDRRRILAECRVG